MERDLALNYTKPIKPRAIVKIKQTMYVKVTWMMIITGISSRLIIIERYLYVNFLGEISMFELVFLLSVFLDSRI